MGQGFYTNGPVIFESVSNVTSTNSVQLGERVTYDGNKYVYVYNAGTSQISVGKGATVSAVSGYSVTVSSTTQADILIGVCHHATIATAQYGWLVVEGFANLSNGMAGTAHAAGDLLTLGADGGFVGAVVTQTANVYAKAMIATASAGAGFGYVKAFCS